MSGELIDNKSYIEKKDIFNNGYGDFSSGSINQLFDVNNDGYVDAVEKDRMLSAGMLNTLESIHPLVARAYNDPNFLINNGFFLTDEQQLRKNKIKLLINKILLMSELEDIKNKRKDRFNEENLNIEKNEEEMDLIQNLQEDLKERQYLEQTEINNQV